jgi:hypothetical protein
MNLIVATSTKRTRGEHSVAVKNANPVYQQPKSYKQRPALIEDLKKSWLKEDKLKPHARSAAKVGLIKAGRVRGFMEDPAKAFDSLVVGISDHINLVTWQVEKSFKGLSDCCGLTTTSENGNVSISRTSNMLKLMREMGLIYWDDKAQVWDKELGTWISKVFYVTEEFFICCGVTPERMERERNKRMFLLKQGMPAQEAGMLTVEGVRRAKRIEYIRGCFESRKNKQGISKLKRESKKAAAKNGLEVLAQKRVLNALDSFELQMMTPAEFTHLVNKEAKYLGKLATNPPPS